MVGPVVKIDPAELRERNLYRPGQTVHYKGIALVADQERDDYRVLPGRPLTVVFNDPNGKEVARQQVRAVIGPFPELRAPRAVVLPVCLARTETRL